MKPKVFFVASVESTIHSFLITHLISLSSRYEVTLFVNTNNPNFLKKYGLKIRVIPRFYFLWICNKPFCT